MEKNSSVYGGVFVRGPNGQTVLVYDETKRTPAWKFPGGGGQFIDKQNRWEAPEETARRELWEETGIAAPTLTLLTTIDRGDHLWNLFEARVENFDGLLRRGNDGEFVSKFPESQLLQMPNFLSRHKKVLADLGLLATT